VKCFVDSCLSFCPLYCLSFFDLRLLISPLVVSSDLSKDLLEYIQSRSLSSLNSIKSFDFSTLYTPIPHSQLKNKLRELVQLCFIKMNGQRRYKYLVIGRDRSDIVNKNTLILPKCSLKLISSTCSRFWLTTCVLSLVDVFFNRQSAYIWMQTVLFSPNCSFIRMRQTSYRVFSGKTKEATPIL
jgi:hypothetical protein